MNAVEITDLRKEYRDTVAVKELTLTVRKGELFGLLGVNGAGKTTTVKMLSGLTPKTSGDAKLMGYSIGNAADRVKIKRITNTSPQETAVAPNLTVRENLEFMAGIYGLSGNELREKCDGIMKELRLDTVSGKKAKTLSGGWQRRLSIGMALVSGPEILFLDEATLGLDVIARRELWEIISALRGKVTAIITTHYLEEAEHLCDRVAIMAGGELRAVGTVQELLALSGCDKFEDAFIKLASEGKI